MKQIISILVLVVLSLTGKAQLVVPGYQGKKTSIGLHYTITTQLTGHSQGLWSYFYLYMASSTFIILTGTNV